MSLVWVRVEVIKNEFIYYLNGCHFPKETSLVRMRNKKKAYSRNELPINHSLFERNKQIQSNTNTKKINKNQIK